MRGEERNEPGFPHFQPEAHKDRPFPMARQTNKGNWRMFNLDEDSPHEPWCMHFEWGPCNCGPEDDEEFLDQPPASRQTVEHAIEDIETTASAGVEKVSKLLADVVVTLLKAEELLDGPECADIRPRVHFAQVLAARAWSALNEPGWHQPRRWEKWWQ